MKDEEDYNGNLGNDCDDESDCEDYEVDEIEHEDKMLRNRVHMDFENLMSKMRQPGFRLNASDREEAELQMALAEHFDLGRVSLSLDGYDEVRREENRFIANSIVHKYRLGRDAMNKQTLTSTENLKKMADEEIKQDMAEGNETLSKFKKLIKNPESEKDEAEELRNYVIESFPKGDDDFDYLKLDDSVEVDKILYRLRKFGVIENLEFSIESKNKKISATIDTDEDFNEYKEVLDSIFINNNTNISWVNNNLGSVTEDFQNGDDAEVTELEDEYILVYSHKLNKFRLYDPKEFEFAWGTPYDELYEDDDEVNEPEVQSEAVVETSKKTSNSNCISWT